MRCRRFISSTFLRGTGLLTDSTFEACLQALLNAIPRTKEKDRFVRIEAELLENLRLNFFDDLTVPAEPEDPVVTVVQQRLDFDEEVEEEPTLEESDNEEE